MPGTGGCLQIPDSDEVVDRCREPEHPAHPAQPSELDFPHQPDGLEPSEDLFNPLTAALAQGVTRMPGRAPVDGTATPAVVLRDMGSDVQEPEVLNKFPGVVPAICSQSDAPGPRGGLDQGQSRLPFPFLLPS